MARGGKIIAPHGVCVCVCVVCVCVCARVRILMLYIKVNINTYDMNVHFSAIYICRYMHVQYSHGCTIYEQLVGTPLGNFK